MDEKTLLRVARRARERELARLRPLLEECLEVIDQYAPGFTELVLDLRAELGADHPTPPPE